MLAESLLVLEIGNKTWKQNKNVSARRTLDGRKLYSGVLLMSFIIRAAATTLAACQRSAGRMCRRRRHGEFLHHGLARHPGAAAAESKVDPACVTLASRIEALRKEGIADKIEKAAAKKYKMTQADLAKADQLTKANADFQFRCSTIMPKSAAQRPSRRRLLRAAGGAEGKASRKRQAPRQLPQPQN